MNYWRLLTLDTDRLTFILETLKTILECGAVFVIGYLWGRNRGFDIGFRLGNMLTECRMEILHTKEQDDVEELKQ